MQHEHEGRSELRRRSGAPGGPLGGPSSAKGHPCAQGELERIKQSLMEDEEEEIGEGSVISEEGDCCPRLDAFERQFLATPPPLQEEGMPKYALLLAVSLTLVGGTFLGSGLRVLLASGIGESIHFLILAFLCLCPGVFHLCIFLGVWIQLPGFSYDMLR